MDRALARREIGTRDGALGGYAQSTGPGTSSADTCTSLTTIDPRSKTATA